MKRRRHAVHVWARYALYLIREFRRIFLFAVAIVMLGGIALRAGGEYRDLGYGKACYAVFCMMFFQPGVVDYPTGWALQTLFFVLPVLGLGAVADSFVRLGYLVFTRKQNLPEWQRMKAAALEGHTIVCGIGKVGFRVINELLALGEPVVAIERTSGGELARDVIERGVPVLFGNARTRSTLEDANVPGARALIAATDDDLANLDAALTAREINPKIHVVLRMFDDTLAAKVASGFGMPAISTSSSAAPSLVAAALGRQVFHAFELGGQRLHFADLVVGERSPLAGRIIADVEHAFDVHIVLRAGKGGAAPAAPSPDDKLAPRDALAVVSTDPDRLAAFEARNRREGALESLRPAGSGR